jgi:hypothetical protein
LCGAGCTEKAGENITTHALQSKPWFDPNADLLTNIFGMAKSIMAGETPWFYAIILLAWAWFREKAVQAYRGALHSTVSAIETAGASEVKALVKKNTEKFGYADFLHSLVEKWTTKGK